MCQLLFKMWHNISLVHTTVADSVADVTDQYFCKLVPMCAENTYLIAFLNMEVSMVVYNYTASTQF